MAVAAAAVSGCGAARKAHETMARQAEHLRVELAETYIEKGALEAAIPLLRRMLEDKPDDVHVRVMYATVLRDLGLFGQAENQFRAAVTQAPDSAAAHAGLAVTYDLQREPEQAQAHHRKALTLAPRAAQLHNNFGFSLYLAGDYEASARQLERALEIDPGLAIAYNNLGFAYGRLGQLDAAERSFRAVGSQPTTLLNMSIVLANAGDTDRAAELRAQAYALSPELRPRASARRPAFPRAGAPVARGEAAPATNEANRHSSQEIPQ